MTADHLTVSFVERDAILQLRADVLSLDGTRISALSGDWSPKARHWVARLDGVMVGCASVMAVRGHVLRGMAVRAEHQKQGVGTALLDEISAVVSGPMWCNARADAVPFYLRRGWTESGPRFQMAVGGATQRMLWTPRTAEHHTSTVAPRPVPSNEVT